MKIKEIKSSRLSFLFDDKPKSEIPAHPSSEINTCKCIILEYTYYNIDDEDDLNTKKTNIFALKHCDT